MIHYTEEFVATVQGTLKAEFELDAKQAPIPHVEDGTKFYFITLSLHAPVEVAENIRQVTYLLDQATYWEPERVSRKRAAQFAEEITSYGDFLVRVFVELQTGKVNQQALLSDMLEEGHKAAMNPAIRSVIAFIRAN